ncbi:MAG: HAMP domain-containing histidine kinase [Bdellovibrionales bacterium]|nr:HAMP domain-containing histidine kinase [Bdellovibrionales bacterium]
MRAKIKFPIRLKLLLLMSALVVASIITYLTLAIKLFRDDKTTLIYDLNANVVRTVASEFRSDLDRYSANVRLLAQGYANPDWRRVILSNETELLAFRLYDAEAAADGKPKLTEVNALERADKFLEEKGISAAEWNAWTNSVAIPPNLSPTGNPIYLAAKFLAPNAPVIVYAEGVAFEGSGRPRVLVGIFRGDRWWATLRSQGVVSPTLIDSSGRAILAADPGALDHPDLSGNPLVARAIGSPLAVELKDFEWGGERYLGAYADVGAGPKIVATVRADEIFRASMRLVNKSLLFGLLIVTIAFLLSSRVARSLTRPLSALVAATESVAQGRFAENVAVRSNDEVGELARKFNAMAGSLDALQKRLVESERHAAIGQVARGVGHEFGNILMRVFGKIDLAMLDTEEPKTKAHLQTALDAVERAKIILQNLRSYSKTGDAAAGPRAPVALGTVVDQTLTLVQHELKTGNIEVKRDFSAGAPSVEGDAVALGQVFLNLMINSKHAMPNGGKLSIAIRPETGADDAPGVAVEVADTGEGIPPDVLPRIFDEAFSTKGDHGSGLGLSISKTIVEGHGGKISAVSAKGAGATFRIWLPERPSVEGKERKHG